ncbi:hypothetical protein M9H77_13059 [Catharanthus roseus]|uniref:Uncharacterized protein n=1 Tax=Catharanthus roseus TaxID=4058 RepID=A0ACC0BJ26_CATRO|nr:hypothetical protein M9H77_13059 [Catharanthus roseus]
MNTTASLEPLESFQLATDHREVYYRVGFLRDSRTLIRQKELGIYFDQHVKIIALCVASPAYEGLFRTACIVGLLLILIQLTKVVVRWRVRRKAALRYNSVSCSAVGAIF